ncbi:phosphopantetheine-binding protein, partial [Kribbella deserti]
RRDGLVPMPSGTGMTLFDQALRLAEPVVVPVGVDLAVLRGRPDLPHGMFRDLVGPRGRRAADERTPRKGVDLTATLAALPAEERTQRLLDLVRREVASVLGHQKHSQINSEHAFKDLGLDSLTALELRNRLNRLSGLKLPATVVFDHPTPMALTLYLRQQLITDNTPNTNASVLTNLDQAKQQLLAATVLPDGLGPIRDSLRELLSLVDANGGDRGQDLSDLDSASDEELFALIDEPTLEH